MATKPEPFAAIETAFKTLVEAQGLSLYDYEAMTLPKMPCATIVPEEVEPSQYGADQGFKIGKIRYTLRAYHNMGKDARLAFIDAKNSVIDVFVALGADRSLGGACRAVDITGTRFAVVKQRSDARPELMVEFDIDVICAPY